MPLILQNRVHTQVVLHEWCQPFVKVIGLATEQKTTAMIQIFSQGAFTLFARTCELIKRVASKPKHHFVRRQE